MLGDAENYVHKQDAFFAENQAAPVGFGRIGSRVLAIMVSDPRVRFFVVNSGGHQNWQSIQNPAWDFDYLIEDYPLEKALGFNGRLVYTAFTSREDLLERYRAWRSTTIS